MSVVKAEDVRKFIISHLDDAFKDIGVTEDAITDDFDLMKMGIIDSIGLIHLIGAIEDHFNIEFNFVAMDAKSITIMGPLCRYIEERAQSRSSS
jgi:acyl carrier protein